MNTTLLCKTCFVFFHNTYVVAPEHVPDGGLASLAPPGVLARC